MATSAHAATRSAEPNRTYWVTLERPELDIAMGAVTLGRRPDWSTAVGFRRASEEEVAFRELDELEYMRRSLRVLDSNRSPKLV